MPAENKLPGFGLPRNYELPVKPFPHALDWGGLGWLSCGTFARERRMLAFMGQITDKPDWQTKVGDDAIVSKWRAEAKALRAVAKGDVYMSDAMFDYCIAELKDKAARSAQVGFVTTLDAELAVAKSDTAVSPDLADELRTCVAVLEDVPDHKKDWHPGSDNKVLDLLHPSLFPVVHGLTRALRSGKVPLDNCVEYTGKGDIVDKVPGQEGEDAENPDGDGFVINAFAPPEVDADTDFMDAYQWLPSDVVLADPASATIGAKITSYVNNLHPDHHRQLYGVLERFVDAAVPLWEECLSSFWDARRFKVKHTDDEEDYYIPEQFKYQIPRSSGRGFHGDGEGSDPDSNGEPDSDEEGEWKYTEEYEEWRNEHRVLKWPEPAPYVPFTDRKGYAKAQATRVDLRDRSKYPEGLQVIFKLANIHLTPDGEVSVDGDVDVKEEGGDDEDDKDDKDDEDDEDDEDDDDDDADGSEDDEGQETSKYYGGSWHVEGTLAERICATALYYYDEENITPSSLAFRSPVSYETLMMIPAQQAYNSLEAYFGVENDEPAVTELGSVLTRPGRLLAFPNVLQHRVGSFKLRDPTKPGHRKILAMFLVDPNRRILSTSVVPPQRRDWWAEKVASDGDSGAGSALSRLPGELFSHTMAMVDEFPISWDEAVDIRADLMEKRGIHVEEQNDKVMETCFSFCEH